MNGKSLGNDFTRKDKEVLKKARAVFSLITGYISDPAWYRFRQALYSLGLITHNLNEDETLEIVRKASKVRKQLPSAGIPFKAVLKFYLQQEKLVSDMGGRSLKGDELVTLVRQQGIPLPNSTRSLWFSSLGGFSKNRYYLAHEIQHILFLAAVYRSRQEQKAQGTVSDE